MRALAIACTFVVVAMDAHADPDDGKPLSPSAITTAIEGCHSSAAAAGATPSFYAAYCACFADYLDGLGPNVRTAVMKKLSTTGEMSAGLAKAVKKCARWAETRGDTPADRTPYSRRNILSAAKTMLGFLSCSKGHAQRLKSFRERMAFCDNVMSSLRRP